MRKFNLIYECDNNHVDIISVPDRIAEDIENLSQLYLDWLPADDDPHYQWTYWGERRIPVKGGADFIFWLNSNYCKTAETAYVEISDVQYDPQFPIIEF